jgi:hypothetical protein
MHRYVMVTLVCVALLACGERWAREDASWRVIDDSASPFLVVEASFGGSSCTRFIEWRVDESETEVDIRAVIERSNAEACTADEVLEETTIELDAPLGDRTLRGCRPDNLDVDCLFVRDPRARP